MWWLLGGGLGFVLLIATTTAVHVMPWAPWWFASKDVGAIQVGGPDPGPPIPVPVITPGNVTDLERYLLARGAGFNPADAITATAISIAEDGSGDPAALSPRNRDGSFDIGLLQINSGWWQRFGGQQALTNPANNFHAGFVIFGLQGWCAWSTWEVRCGPGHTGAYAAFLNRARAAAGLKP